MTRVGREFYARETVLVARELLGMHLVRVGPGKRRRIGRIVETEAYKGPDDRAAHSWRGRTPRTAIMFGPPGYAYVFMIYGFWYCLNFVTEAEGCPCAVLIRALEPVSDITDKTWGPGLLCRALDIDRTQNGVDLAGGEIFVARPDEPKQVRIAASARIGVAYAGHWAKRKWRFYDRDSSYVSTAKRSRAEIPDTKQSRSSRSTATSRAPSR